VPEASGPLRLRGRKQIVEQIDARGHQAEGDEGQKGLSKRLSGQLVGRQHRHEDEKILQPLMGAQGFQIGLGGWEMGGQLFHFLAQSIDARLERSRRVHHNGF
jgi:hypothetical protein